MRRFTLKTVLLKVTFAGVLFGWVQLYWYSARCVSFHVPAYELESAQNSVFRHDRMLLKTPDGTTYEPPRDPVTIGVLVMFVITLSFCVILSLAANRSRDREA